MRHQDMSSSQERKHHKSSLLLSNEENQQVFGLLDKNCVTLSTAVVQLFLTEPHAHSHWVKRYTGALCFVKDSNKKSYFCRIYCLMRNELVWEQELYTTIQFNKPRPYLINFEGQDGHVAFNFASEDEADNFYRAAQTMIEMRRRRREERRRRDPPPRPPSGNPTEDAPDMVVLRQPQSMMPSMTAPGSQYPSNKMPTNTGMNFGGGLNKDKKRGAKRINKADIGAPTNFKHITHVGWDEQKGFDLTGEEVETLKPFLQKAGVSEKQLSDRETRAFIYDFIQNHNVLDALTPEPPVQKNPYAHRQPQLPPQNRQPPPVPSRQPNKNGGTRTAPPPPPPSSNRVHPPPETPPTGHKVRTPPSRPSPPVQQPSAAPPPPPPPPPPPMAPPMPLDSSQTDAGEEPVRKAAPPAAPDARSALMESIRKGAMLKKVDQPQSQATHDSRVDLLQEIRQGKELRPAAERELTGSAAANRVSDNSAGGGTDALADALRRALQERGRVIRSSDEDSDTSDTDNDGEWDD